MKYYIRRSKSDDKTYLAHYGVKGMRWGIRKAVEYTTPAAYGYKGAKKIGNKIRVARLNKYRNENGNITASGRARFTDEGKKKNVRQMSNKDLKKSTERLTMENRYKAALREERTNRTSTKIARTAVKAGLSYAAAKGSIYLINQKTGAHISDSYSNKIAIISALIGGFSEWGINLNNLTDIYKKH